jgi:hypothetical protein
MRYANQIKQTTFLSVIFMAKDMNFIAFNAKNTYAEDVAINNFTKITLNML